MTAVPAGLKAVDWTQYHSWPSFVGSDGHTYYIPPGGEGYAYDPFLHHLFQDGRAAKKAADQATADQQKAIKDANSPARQFEQIAGVAGLTAGVPIAARNLFPSAVESAQANYFNGLAGGAAGAPAVEADAAYNAAMAPYLNGTAGAVQNAGAAANSALQSGENAVAPTSFLGSAAPYLGIAGAGLGAYEINNAIKTGSVSQGAVGGLGLGAGLATAAPLLIGAGPVGWGVLAASAAGGALLGGGAAKLLHHETTREYQKKNTQSLLGQSSDPTWQGYVSAMRGQNETGPSDASMPYGDTKGNKYANFDAYKAAGLDAANLTGVVGNLQTYGPAWAKLTEAQRQAITQKNIDANLYSSKKGEVVITDPGTAKSNFDAVVSGGVAVPTPAAPQQTPIANNAAAAAQAAVAAGAAPVVVNNPIRSQTKSPGINLKGQYVNY